MGGRVDPPTSGQARLSRIRHLAALAARERFLTELVRKETGPQRAEWQLALDRAREELAREEEALSGGAGVPRAPDADRDDR